MINFLLEEDQCTNPGETHHLAILTAAKAAAAGRAALSWLRILSEGEVPGQAPPPGHSV